MNKKILLSLLVMLIIVIIFAVLNMADREDRLLSQREAVLFINYNNELTQVSFDEILSLEQFEIETVLRSSSSDDKNHVYTGIRIKDLLNKFNINFNESNQLITKSVDGFTVVLSGKEVLDEDNVYIAYKMDGEPLTSKDRGGSGPYQIIVSKDTFAQRWNKFLMELEIR